MLKEAIVLNPVYVTFFWSMVFLVGLKKGDRQLKSLFFFMFAAFALYLGHALFFSGYLLIYSYMDGLYLFCSLSVYPLFYFYVRNLSTPEGVRKIDLLHLLPPFTFAVLQYIFYGGLSPAERIEYLQETLADKIFEHGKYTGLYENAKLARYAFAIQVIVYFYLIIRLLKRHQHVVSQIFSNEERYGLGWVKKLTFLLLLMALTSFSLALAGREPFARNEHLLLVPSSVITVSLFIFGYIGNIQLRKTELISPIILREDHHAPAVQTNDGLKNRFDEYFNSRKPYLDKELKIWDVSNALGSNRSYVSRIINEEYGMNFSHFVNKYRIEEAKRIIAEDRNNRMGYDIIAEASGFGSVNSFFRAFREFEKMTPGKYRGMLEENGINS